MRTENQRCVRGARGLSEILGVGLSFAEGLIRRGEVKTLRAGRCVVVELAEVDRYLARLRDQQHGAAR